MTQALSLLVIGYGNSLRRDDGAGLLLSARLAEAWQSAGVPVRCIQTHQLTPDLAEEMADPMVSHVIFVDARVAEEDQEEDQAGVGFESISPDIDPQQSIGHQMGPAMLLTYADRLFGRAPSAHVITVPGVDFGFGDELSNGVRQILDDAEAIAQQFLATLDACG